MQESYAWIEDGARAVELYKQGATQKAIGKELKRSAGWVNRQINLSGVSRRKTTLPYGHQAWTDERVETLTSMIAAGRSSAEIAKALGTTRNAIIGRAHRMGLKLAGHIGGRKDGAGRPAGPDKKPRKARTTPFPKVPKFKPSSLGPRVAFDPPVEQRVPFLETKRGQCLWICEDKQCCGSPAFETTSWCSEHYRVVYKTSRR